MRIAEIGSKISRSMKRPRCTPRQSSASRRCEAGFASSGTPSQTSHARVSASARFRVLDRPRDANSAHLKSHPPSGGETKTHSYKETNQQTAAISLRQTRRCGKNKTKQKQKLPKSCALRQGERSKPGCTHFLFVFGAGNNNTTATTAASAASAAITVAN